MSTDDGRETDDRRDTGDRRETTRAQAADSVLTKRVENRMSTSERLDDYETAIASYRAQLRAEAELADGDLDEIEDHLRSLTDDLRARGMPAAEAVTTAAQRLGNPRTIAREHSRVRSAFGSRLSTARTWSVIALLAPMLVLGAINMYEYTGLWSRYMFEFAAGGVLLVALALRMGWARPVLLGGLGYYAIPSATMLAISPGLSPLYIAWHVGIIAFLVPWKRNELTRSGLALAASVWAYGVSSWILGFDMTSAEGGAEILNGAVVATIAAALATSGAILRARWSSIAGVVAAVALGVALIRVAQLHYRFDSPSVMEVLILGSLVTGVCAALAGAVLNWRTARSMFGSLRAIRS